MFIWVEFCGVGTCCCFIGGRLLVCCWFGIVICSLPVFIGIAIFDFVLVAIAGVEWFLRSFVW